MASICVTASTFTALCLSIGATQTIPAAHLKIGDAVASRNGLDLVPVVLTSQSIQKGMPCHRFIKDDFEVVYEIKFETNDPIDTYFIGDLGC